MEVHAEFTDCVQATASVACERESCKAMIQPGEQRHYVHNKKQPENPGKRVCKRCFLYYTSNTQTSIRPTASREAVAASQIDVNAIRKSVNESQRKGAHTPQGRTTALPPNFSGSGTSSGGPSIANPHVVHGSMINGQFVPHPSNPAPPPIIGYSSAHAQHSQATQEWAKRAATGKGILGGMVENLISCNIEVYQPERGPKGPISLKDVMESIKVNNDISSCDLRREIMDEICQPLIAQLARRGVFVDAKVIEPLIIRESSGGVWNRVDPTSTASYFGSRFLTASRRKSDITAVFRLPSKKPLVFGVVLSHELWSRIVEKEELEFVNKINSIMPPPADIPRRMGDHSYTFKTASEPKTIQKRTKRVAKRAATPSSSDSDSDMYMPEYITVPKNTGDHPKTRASTKSTQPPKMKKPKSGSHTELEDRGEPQIGTAQRPIEFQDGDSDSDSGQPTSKKIHPPNPPSATSTGSFPSPFPANATALSIPRSKTGFVPLKADTISRGFQQGGTCTQRENSKDSGQIISESILFFPLPNKSFLQLMEFPHEVIFISILPSEGNQHFHAHLAYNPSPKVRLGKGSFKIAVAAALEFDGIRKPSTGLGSLKCTGSNSSSIPVALKRPFIHTPANADDQSKNVVAAGGGAPARLKRKESRLSYSDEKQAISGEANLLVWANALLKYSYDFVIDHIDSRTEKGEHIPGYVDEIPAFRFVEAGVAIATKNIENEGSSNTPTSHRAVYLLEEMLPVAHNEFIKYINNSNAVPLLTPKDRNYYLAEFLSFIQHVQVQITHKLSYISDFQGVGTVLTDPQIMTSPELGAKLFGGGNLGDAFERFPKEHRCNKYCKWFCLEDLDV